MKRILIPIILVFFVTAISHQLNAQKDKKKLKTVTLKIEKDTDEGKTVIDTTFALKDGEDLDKILEQYGVKAAIHEKHKNAFNIEIETDDSLASSDKEMVWVSVDTDDDAFKTKTKIKSKHKQVVFISNDGDEDVEIISPEDEEVFKVGNSEENIIWEELDGDSVKITKKIVIQTDDKPKHKRIKKVYEFTSDSLEHGEQMVFITDDDDHNIIIRKQNTNNDSVEIIVKKLKKGKHGKHVYITADDDLTWNTDEDVHFESKDGKTSKVKVEIIDPTKEDLNKLKLKENYNKLKISNFFLFLNKEKDKMDLKFTAPEKGNLSVKIFDELGKTVFSDDKKQFEGKYKNETKALKGTFIVQISQDKKYFVRKMILDWK